MSEVVSFSGQRGAGLYGGRSQSHKTACANSNNAFGHSSACPCRVRASQMVPYMDCPASVCDEETHEACWSDYSRQEDERKYRPSEGGFLMGETQ